MSGEVARSYVEAHNEVEQYAKSCVDLSANIDYIESIWNKLSDKKIEIKPLLESVLSKGPYIYSSLYIYMVARFEANIKEQVVDVLQTTLQGCTAYDELPRKIQDANILYSSMVLGAPRKYGYSDSAIKTIISNLYDNITNNRAEISTFNTNAIAITHENMRPDTIEDIFSRVGVNGVVKKISQQASIQTFLEITNPEQCEKEIRLKISKAIDERNNLVHPGATKVLIGSSDILIDKIGILKYFILALDEVAKVFVLDNKAAIKAAADRKLVKP